METPELRLRGLVSLETGRGARELLVQGSTLSLTGRHGLFILGMHRSGTSTLAGVLGRLGGQLPKQLMPPGPDNPAGYFESQAIYLLNEQLMVHLDAGWDDLRPFPTDWLESREAPQWLDGFAHALELEFPDPGWFVLKDPRLIWLFPLWERVAHHAGLDASWVTAVRPPLLAADSLYRAEAIDAVRAVALWLHHLTTAEQLTRHRRRAFVAYEELAWHPVGAMQRLSQTLGVDVLVAAGEEEQVRDFVRPPTPRETPATRAAASSAHLSGWLGSAYRWVLAVLRYERPPEGIMDRIHEGLRTSIATGRLGDPRGVHARRRDDASGRPPSI